VKKTGIPYIITIAVIFLLVGCTKYEDGPWFSLRSRIERVSNTWKVENYIVNGDDLTSLYQGYTETFTSDLNYSYQWGVFGGSGTWAFQNKHKEIRITGISNLSSKTLIILKLKEKEFWYYYMDGDDRKEFHMTEN